MPHVWRGIDGTYLTPAAIVADSGFLHTHASATQGGQLDWDDVWSDAVHSHASDAEGGTLDWDLVWADAVHSHISNGEGGKLDWDFVWDDAVHSHQSDAEGGALDGAAITTTITGSGNVVKATGPTVTTLTVASGGAAVTGNVTVTGSVTATLSGGEAVAVRSGGATSYTAIAIGRTATDGVLAVAGNADNWFDGTASGDIAIRQEDSAKAIHLGVGSTGSAELGITNGTVTVNGALTVSTGDLTVTAGDIQMDAAASQLVPGATSFAVRNNADSADNLLVSNAGAVTTRSALTVAAGGAAVTGNSTVTGTLNVTSTHTITGTGGLRVESTTPAWLLKDTDAASDEKVWRFAAGGTQLHFQTLNDAENTFNTWLLVTRSGATVSGAALTGTLSVSSTLTMDGALDHNGSTAGFYGTAPTTKPTVTGSRGGNAALASLLTALAGLGLLTDSSTA